MLLASPSLESLVEKAAAELLENLHAKPTITAEIFASRP